mmetsp:Transcript_10385/g.47651  ORF Transcript_10385/g.47651 Transcript_10385/m.47651 type:complete len:341 (-) Transcript_10385:919-1941(-)
MRTPCPHRLTPRRPARRRSPRRHPRRAPLNWWRMRLKNFERGSPRLRVGVVTSGHPRHRPRSRLGPPTLTPDPARPTAFRPPRSTRPSPRCVGRSEGSPPRRRRRRRRRSGSRPEVPSRCPRWPRPRPRPRGRGKLHNTRRRSSASSSGTRRLDPWRTSRSRCRRTRARTRRSWPPRRIGNSRRNLRQSARSSNGRNRAVSRFERARCARASRARWGKPRTPSPSPRRRRRNGAGKSRWSRSFSAFARLRTRLRSATPSRTRFRGVSTRLVPRRRSPRVCPTCTVRLTPCFERKGSGWNKPIDSPRRRTNRRGAPALDSNPRPRSRLRRSTGTSGSWRGA